MPATADSTVPNRPAANENKPRNNRNRNNNRRPKNKPTDNGETTAING